MEEKGTLYYLKKSYYFAKENKKNFIFYMIGSILVCVVGAIIPLFVAKELLALTGGVWEQLFYAAITVFALEMLRNILHLINGKNSQRFFRSTLKNTQLKVAEEILKISASDFNKSSSGYFIERISNDSAKIADIFLELNSYLTEIIMNIGILASIFILNRQIFLFYCFFLIILYLIQKKKNISYQANDKVMREKRERATSLMTELVRGATDIKVLNAEKSFLEEAERRIVDLNQARYHMFDVNRLYRFFYSSTRDILDFTFILLAIFLIKEQLLTVSTAVIVFNYRNQVIVTLDYVGNLMQKLKEFSLSSSRVFQIIEGVGMEKETFGKKKIKKIHGNFEFQNVSFQYEENIPILKNINFKVPANHTVSFVGKSGSGKTTIFNLLAKLYDTDEGTILIDGFDIKKLNKDSIRGNLSIINQSPYIFNMSIRENFQVVKKNLKEKEMIEACKAACLHDYIMSLPDGYDTVVGEGGISLSGGQRQRLAIARALVQKTEIILLDEATSALDNETQLHIQQAIENMKGEYTILIIAHRLSTIVNSDKIFLMEDGEIKGEGTHEELLKNNSYYQQLYALELQKEESSK